MEGPEIGAVVIEPRVVFARCAGCWLSSVNLWANKPPLVARWGRYRRVGNRRPETELRKYYRDPLTEVGIARSS
jgi:hypothetical protein